jgi:hypothetical protein
MSCDGFGCVRLPLIRLSDVQQSGADWSVDQPSLSTSVCRRPSDECRIRGLPPCWRSGHGNLATGLLHWRLRGKVAWLAWTASRFPHSFTTVLASLLLATQNLDSRTSDPNVQMDSGLSWGARSMRASSVASCSYGKVLFVLCRLTTVSEITREVRATLPT